MADIFLKTVNMSISAGWIVLALMLLRLLLKKAPKWISCILWGIVGLRLIMPFSLESVFSLIPSAETISKNADSPRPHFESGFTIVDNQINDYLKGNYFEGVTRPMGNFIDVTTILGIAWIIGIIALLTYTVISYLRLKRKVDTAVLLCDNIFQSENVISPFVLGIVKPKIYLPFDINESDMNYVIAHERAHIKRKDHWWKPLGFLLLTVYWFNPLIWVGYILLCRDIELACDEKVVKELDGEQRADYSEALLTCSVNRRMIAACPLAFGEVGVKNRIKSVLNYRKPAFWVIITAVIASIIAAVCFLTDPINTSESIIKKLARLEDYEVIEQDIQKITLSIPVSALPDDIFSEDGHQFREDEIIAYQDDTATVCLKEAQYSNEGNDNLYFCFDFAFDLPKEKGKTIYPFEILDNGLGDSVRVTDSIMRADNGEFGNAVHDRGQGPDELIWFYVSTDALKQAQGTISFDIYINQIIYFLNGEDYSSISNIGGVDESTKVITAAELETLRARFPMYFDLSTAKGLEVYIWQMAEDSYSCGLLPGKNRDYTQEELWNLHKASATLDEMKAIVCSYSSLGITPDDVVICPIPMPHSSYLYTIDEAYQQKITNLFWSDFPTMLLTSYSPIIDTATFDIDGDGREERCTLSCGPTSGLFTFKLNVWEIGSTDSKFEYFNIFNGESGNLSFAETDSGMKLRLETYGDEPKTIYYDFGIKDGNITLTSNGEAVAYWGEQGVGSVYSPVQLDENGTVTRVESYPYNEEFDEPKKSIYNKMLNTIDYFNKIELTLETNMLLDDKCEVYYHTDIDGGIGYEAIIQNKATVYEDYCEGNFLIEIDNLNKIYTKEYYPDYKRTDSPYIPLDKRVVIQEDGHPGYYYRQNISRCGYSSFSIVPQEITFSYLADFDKWEITNESINFLGRSCIEISGTPTDYSAQKQNCNTFTMLVDSETGILMKFTALKNGKTTNYIAVKEIAFDTEIPVKQYDENNYKSYTQKVR